MFCYESSRKKAKAVVVLCGFGNSGVAGVVHFSVSTGPHYNPTGEEHGDPGDPIGDLGNVVAGDGGQLLLASNGCGRAGDGGMDEDLPATSCLRHGGFASLSLFSSSASDRFTAALTALAFLLSPPTFACGHRSRHRLLRLSRPFLLPGVHSAALKTSNNPSSSSASCRSSLSL
ncbi:hypothetical protein ZIOFF_032773 [Zingiber officinale]|uniref:Uncharacterized protein n=1 Tax=Zingiber officinale TaxID=94328 RepID=A0A8J5GW14_ZINOF|nr:hypothetical protein ZIOFF_032773 [Zingiber officinale]